MAQLLLALAILLVGPVADAATAKYTFTVGSMQINQLCSSTSIIAVNGQLPGPSIEVNEGDDVEVKVVNNSPYNVTIHWHGVLQLMTPWADGPSMVTQCPIQPSSSYTYRFSVPGQEGTLWWHAHSSFLRATVYGAFIIRPRRGNAYPFPAPDKEVPIVLGCHQQASGGTAMWSTSRATPSWPVSFPPSPTRSQLTAKPACCTSAQTRRSRRWWSPTRGCCCGSSTQASTRTSSSRSPATTSPSSPWTRATHPT